MAFISRDRIRKLAKEYPDEFESLTTPEGEKLFRKSIWISYMTILLGKVILFGVVWVVLSKIDHLWSELFAALFAIFTIKTTVDQDFNGLEDSVIDIARQEFAKEKSDESRVEKPEDGKGS